MPLRHDERGPLLERLRGEGPVEPDTPIDFEIEDALGKLKRLKLCEITGTANTGDPVWTAVPLTEACERLDFLWDNFFQLHAPHV